MNYIHGMPTDRQYYRTSHIIGPRATKPVFGISNKVRLKPVSSATETSYTIEISPVASLDMIHSKTRILKALISLRGCAGWTAPLLFANLRRQVFSRRGPIMQAAKVQTICKNAVSSASYCSGTKLFAKINMRGRESFVREVQL